MRSSLDGLIAEIKRAKSVALIGVRAQTELPRKGRQGGRSTRLEPADGCAFGRRFLRRRTGQLQRFQRQLDPRLHLFSRINGLR